MTRQIAIRAVLMRGGTSKAVFLHAGDLPAGSARRDRVILSVFGSPDPRQIDGLGGADPLTSKVAIIAPSSSTDADVDYTFGYVGIGSEEIDYAGNCGNISQAVGPFAVDEGLVGALEPLTRVRILNTNTGKIMVAEVPTRDGRALVEGDFSIHGVPGTGARLVLNFENAAGAKTGRLLPTGNVTDELVLANGRRVTVSLVDVANPAVFVRAADVGLTGSEVPQDCGRDPEILRVMEEIRVQGALRMKLAEEPARVSAAIPKVAIVAPPGEYRTISGERVLAEDCDLLARTLALSVMHKAYAVTGGLCLSAAALIEGTVVSRVARPRIRDRGLVRVGHPSGVSQYMVSVGRTPSGELGLERAAVAGTARRIMDGRVYVPGHLVAGVG